jgi:hypothetical protein
MCLRVAGLRALARLVAAGRPPLGVVISGISRPFWPKLLSLVRTSSNRKPPGIDRDLDAAPVRLARLSSPQEAGPPRGLYPSRSAPSERSPYSQPIVTRRCSVAPKICWFGPRPRYWVVGDDSQGRLRTREAHVGKGIAFEAAQAAVRAS